MRIAAGVSLRELAAVLGVDPASLSRWETGAVVPRAKAAARWEAEIARLDQAREGAASSGATAGSSGGE